MIDLRPKRSGSSSPFSFQLLPLPTLPHYSLDRKPVRKYRPPMNSISYTEARDRLASVWDEAISTRQPITISRRGKESVVLVAMDEWEGLQETAHLLRSPTNARRLLEALTRLGEGEGESITVSELTAKTSLR